MCSLNSQNTDFFYVVFVVLWWGEGDRELYKRLFRMKKTAVMYLQHISEASL